MSFLLHFANQYTIQEIKTGNIVYHQLCSAIDGSSGNDDDMPEEL